MAKYHNAPPNSAKTYTHWLGRYVTGLGDADWPGVLRSTGIDYKDEPNRPTSQIELTASSPLGCTRGS